MALKKIISVLAALALMLTFAACVNSQPVDTDVTTEGTTAEVPVPGSNNDYKYDEYSDHIVLTDYLGYSATVRLPEKINNKPVTSFGKIFRSSLTLTTIFIPASYTAIEDEAFSECYKLASVTVYKGSLTSIGSKAFYGCQALKYASIPETVTYVADDAFKYCTDLFIYGKTGSAIDKFASGFSSIYFRDTAEDTTVPETTIEAPNEEESTEETSAQESTTKKKTASKPTTTKAPQTEAETTTARGSLIGGLFG